MSIKNYKLWIFAVIVVLVVISYLNFYYNQKKEFKLITNDEELASFMQNMEEGDLEEYLAKKDELYAQDIYGGETPEETLTLFIDALKAGDVELASKYFKLEDQERELDRLNNLDEDNIKNYIEFSNSNERMVFCNEENDNCDIDIKFDGDNVSVARFILNKETNKWKMESLQR